MTDIGDITTRGGSLAALLAVLLLAPLDAAAQEIDAPRGDAERVSDESVHDKASVEDKLVFALSSYHAAPTRDELDDIAPPDMATAWLRAFASSPALRPSMRTRAIDALGHYDEPKTRGFLERIVADPSSVQAPARVADAMRHHAITSLARAHADAALDVLAPLLASDDLQVRLTTVVALGKHGGERSRARLKELRDETENRAVSRQIDTYVDAHRGDD